MIPYPISSTVEVRIGCRSTIHHQRYQTALSFISIHPQPHFYPQPDLNSSPTSSFTALPSSQPPPSTSSSTTLPHSYHHSPKTTTIFTVPAPAEVEATIQRILQHKNFQAVIILDQAGVVIQLSGPILQGSDGPLVLGQYVSEAYKLVESMSKAIEGMEVDVSIIRVPSNFPFHSFIDHHLCLVWFGSVHSSGSVNPERMTMEMHGH